LGGPPLAGSRPPPTDNAPVSEIQRFVADARQRGMDAVAIRTLLSAAGWKDRQILAALASGEDGLHVPSPTAAHSPRDTVRVALAFLMLHATVIATVVQWFSFLDRWLPDPAANTSDYAEAYHLEMLRYRIATLLVSTPTFFLLWRRVVKGMQTEGTQPRSGAQRWLTWITIALAFLTVAGNAIALIFAWLNGGLTSRFLWKSLILSGAAIATIQYLKSTATDAEGEQ